MERQSDVLVKYSHPTFPKAIRDFTVVATVQLNDTSGGYLFAILNPLGTVVQLGLAIRPTIRFVYNITLIYTDTRLHLDSQTLAVFQVPAIKDEITVAIKIFLQKATLYINCNEVRTIAIRSDPIDVRTDSDSKLYVASAGPLGGEFDVSEIESVRFACGWFVWCNVRAFCVVSGQDKRTENLRGSGYHQQAMRRQFIGTFDCCSQQNVFSFILKCVYRRLSTK